jgi:hypothetical protein
MNSLNISDQHFLRVEPVPGFCARIRLHVQIATWLDENQISYEFINHYTTEMMMEYWLRFDNSADLIAFKMRWWGQQP